MTQPQLTLVHTRPAERKRVALPHASPAVVRIFGHWVDMMGKNPKRCALGPDRRRSISRALELYDEETLLLAIEGCATDPWHLGDNDRRTEYTDIALILRDEAHIERFAAKGEEARERAERAHADKLAAAHAAQCAQVPQQPDAGAVEEQRERLRALQRSIAAGVGRR
jgi:hypothetical protein